MSTSTFTKIKKERKVYSSDLQSITSINQLSAFYINIIYVVICYEFVYHKHLQVADENPVKRYFPNFAP